MIKIKLDNNQIKLIYKLLIDFLALYAVSFFILLIGETVLPGIVSSRIDFAFLTAILAGLILLISFLGSELKLKFAINEKKEKSKLFYAALVVCAGLLILSSIKFNLLTIPIILIVSGYILRTLYLEFLKK